MCALGCVCAWTSLCAVPYSHAYIVNYNALTNYVQKLCCTLLVMQLLLLPLLCCYDSRAPDRNPPVPLVANGLTLAGGGRGGAAGAGSRNGFDASSGAGAAVVGRWGEARRGERAHGQLWWWWWCLSQGCLHHRLPISPPLRQVCASRWRWEQQLELWCWTHRPGRGWMGLQGRQGRRSGGVEVKGEVGWRCEVRAVVGACWYAHKMLSYIDVTWQ